MLLLILALNTSSITCNSDTINLDTPELAANLAMIQLACKNKYKAPIDFTQNGSVTYFHKVIFNKGKDGTYNVAPDVICTNGVKFKHRMIPLSK